MSSSLWFVPLLLVLGAILLAVLLVATDLAIGNNWTSRYPLVFGVGASGARGMLAAIAGSMITVASLTFSLTISTLATASSQYTSRLIRNFMRDRLSQFVLGYFVGLFAYCLVVLRTIRSGEDDAAFVPALAVMGGLLLAFVSIGVLIVFIHHIAESIQAGNILRRVTGETLQAIDGMFPAGVQESLIATGVKPASAQEDSDSSIDWDAQFRRHTYLVSAQQFGYIEALDAESLLSLAADRDGLFRILADTGAFVTPAGMLCEITVASPPTKELVEAVRSAFEIGPARTIEQDAAFGIRQIVDIALKALSPGINDTTTGVMCVEHLAAVLEALAAKDIPDRRRATDGRVRLFASGRSFDVLAGLCLNQIRQSASGNTAVMVALLRAIEAAGRQTSDRARRRTLSRHASLVATLARDSVPCTDDEDPVTTNANVVIAELDSPLRTPRGRYQHQPTEGEG